VLLPDLQREFAVGPEALARVFSTSLVAFTVAVLTAGRLVRRHGPRGGATLAGGLSGAGLAVTALAPGVLALHAGYGLLFGAGSGLAYSSVVTWASTRTGSDRGWSIGVVVAAYAAGPVAGAPLGTLLADQWGWRPTAGMAAVGVATVCLLAGRALPGAVPIEQPLPSTDVRVAGQRRALAALWLLFLAATGPALFAFAYGADVVAERGLGRTAAGLVLALMGAGNLAGRLFAGPLAARIGVLPALRADVALLGAALAGLAWLPGATVVVVGLPLLALQYGGVSTLLPSAVRAVVPATSFSTAYGQVFTSWGVAGVLAPALHGTSHDYATGFRSLLIAAVMAAVALAAFARWLPSPGRQPR
jgi:MFS transporter, OFA family, oxalate/formate antiporter